MQKLDYKKLGLKAGLEVHQQNRPAGSRAEFAGAHTKIDDLINYKKLGLKAGLEVHQQLDTGKLFIRTPSKLTEETDFTIERKLRPVASELGEYDKTAIDAFKRNETFYYSGKKENISLVELDDEPPQPMDKEALHTVLEVAQICNSNIV
ncbi:MAG: hypothetical protein NTY48_05530, partial [Candidatus Diapherotrites archaeon]|nr:hypothetical protein [Candidatus Diapherotrites archaeon]